MKIAVVGTGYVGLVAGACFADSGTQVVCVDIDASKVERLKRAEIPIYEPGLEEIVRRGLDNKRLSFTTEIAEAVELADVIFLAVGTPSLPNGDPDLSYVEAAARAIGKAMNGPKVVVNKSTVPIGSHHLVADWIKEHTKFAISVASNPEFLKEGSAVKDFLMPDRVVIGTEDDHAYTQIAELYAPFCRQGNPIIRMDPVSAELTKYACNAFLAVRISFMNELSRLCEKVGGDVDRVRQGMGTDVRIGKYFLYAGVGYGGSCFPKDIRALLSTAKKNNSELGIVDAAEHANAVQKTHLIGHILEKMGAKSGAKPLAGKRIGVWGLAFKPNTDDMREAPATAMIESLLDLGATITAYDPVAMPNAKQILGDRILYAKTAMDTLEGADAWLLVTEWNEFRYPDFDEAKAKMKRALVFDGRNHFDPARVKAAGFEYVGVGRISR